MCLKLWISFSFHAANAKAIMHTEETVNISQAAEHQFCFSCKVLRCVASPISGAGRRGRSNVFEALVAWLWLPCSFPGRGS